MWSQGRGEGPGRDRARAHLGINWSCRDVFIFSYPKGFLEVGVVVLASVLVMGWQMEGISPLCTV